MYSRRAVTPRVIYINNEGKESFYYIKGGKFAGQEYTNGQQITISRERAIRLEAQHHNRNRYWNHMRYLQYNTDSTMKEIRSKYAIANNTNKRNDFFGDKTTRQDALVYFGIEGSPPKDWYNPTSHIRSDSR